MPADDRVDAATAEQALAPDDLSGQPVTISVRLRDGDQADWTVYGELYLPEGAQPDTVQLLVPGLTYDHRYWTVPGDYNYAAHMVRAGHAVFALDRIGTGRSGRPPAMEVNAESNAVALHDVVQALRVGVGGAAPFERVVVVGHSFGSGVALVEAARYHDVDALVISGMLHTTAPLYQEVIAFFHQATEDPVIADPTLPVDYATQRPGLRARMLEYGPSMDPAVSRHNELMKSTATLGEGNSLPLTYEAEISRAVRVPVLVVVGQHDALFSSADVSFAATAEAVADFERSFYAPDVPLEAYVVADCGHSLNIHRNAREWFEIARTWVERLPRRDDAAALESVG